MPRRNRVLLVALLGLGALVPLTPAVPAGAALPVPTFTTDETSGPDVNKGDGVCANASGGCSLQAAFDEAIALRRGTIVVATPPDAVTAAVRGSISLRGPGHYLDQSTITVERGATLTVGQINLSTVDLTVRGRLVLDGTVVLDPDRFKVDPPGTATVRNTIVYLDGAPLVNNGRLSLVYATVQRAFDPADRAKAIQTGTGATTTLVASNLVGPRGNGRACGGTKPVSEGYNLSFDWSCLTHPTDLGIYVQGPTLGPAGTPRVDAVPAGEAGCGTTVTTDLAGGLRPMDGDGDGTAACDIGYAELPPPSGSG
ncbi:MAG TPA: hypothetical protein VF228_10735 [Iamia sp.]